MSGKPNGYGLMQLGGQERPFHVGLEQAEIFSRLANRLDPATGRGMSISAYNNLFSLDVLRENKLEAGDLRDFVFSALASGAIEDGLPVDFTPRMVSQWIDDADDPTQPARPLLEMLAQAQQRWERQAERLKNAAPPKATKPKAKGAKH